MVLELTLPSQYRVSITADSFTGFMPYLQVATKAKSGESYAGERQLSYMFSGKLLK